MPFDSTLITDWCKEWLIRLRSGMVANTGLSDIEVEWLLEFVDLVWLETFWFEVLS